MQDNSKPSNDQHETQSDQGIFAERFDVLMNGFGQACEQNEVAISIAIAIHPKEEQPMVFIRGHHYDAAKLIAFVLRKLKIDLLQELDI